MTPPSWTRPTDQRPTIGIGTGINERLVDPGAVRALSFAAEELGYSSVWTFDSPAGQRWSDQRSGRRLDDVLDTLDTFVHATTRITVGVALLRGAAPLPAHIAQRLLASNEASAGRLVIARPASSTIDGTHLGRMLQMWSPDVSPLAAWASGWMLERWDRGPSGIPVDDPGDVLVVRLPVHEGVDRLVDEIDGLGEVGATEIVLDVVADEGVDHALALYSRIAEAVEDRLGRRIA